MTPRSAGRRGRVGGRAIAVAAAVIASSAALAGCASSSSSAAGDAAAAGVRAISLATSLSTANDTWAIVPMTANPTFWEVFVRPAASTTWKLVTPPGVADNGGLVAAADSGRSLTVAVRPSQDLTFTPLTSTADAGGTWSTGNPLDAGLAASPGALAVSGRELAALLGNGTIETSSDAGSSWQTLARPTAIADSAAGKQCGTVGVTAVSFGPPPDQVLAAGRCGATGAAAFFSHTPDGSWQRLSLPASGQLVRLGDGTALVRAKAGLTGLWLTGWYASTALSSSSAPAANWSASAALPVTRAVVASGGLASGSAQTPAAGMWVLLPGGQAATISGPRQQWLLLPPVPAHTSVLASGPGNSVDALAVSGSTLTVWQLDHGSTIWAKAQTMSVPIQYGSSS